MKTCYKTLISAHRCYIVITKQYDNGVVVHNYKELRSITFLINIKQNIRLILSKSARYEKMKAEVKEYMRNEWIKTTPTQYHKYFDEWFSNVTEYQMHCFNVWRTGKMGPFF
ncbi:hypothetical protein [uncultured Methanobrevibacter sp.]|uniref:hypothetical protein n=1 Tax=uncultured Methanobrevibacter sp. TaxID=253161 RepID=UPI0025E29899|nr:hypothetical protein [uncultured Methanobrevibacter sp.]